MSVVTELVPQDTVSVIDLYKLWTASNWCQINTLDVICCGNVSFYLYIVQILPGDVFSNEQLLHIVLFLTWRLHKIYH